MTPIRKPWTSQPQQPVGTRFRYGLDPVVCTLGSLDGVDSIDRKTWLLGSAAVRNNATPAGRGMYFPPLSTTLSWATKPYRLRAAVPPACTLIVDFYCGPTTPYAPLLFGTSSDGGSYYIGGGAYNWNVYFGAMGKSTLGLVTLGPNQRFTIVGSRRESDGAWHTLGFNHTTPALQESSGTSATTPWDANGTAWLGGISNEADRNIGATICLAVYSEQWIPLAAAREIVYRPYSIFEPRQIIIPTATAAGYTHPTMSNARMGSLTSTGGVPLVDYAF